MTTDADRTRELMDDSPREEPEREPKAHRWHPKSWGWRCLDCGCNCRSDAARDIADAHECDPWD